MRPAILLFIEYLEVRLFIVLLFAYQLSIVGALERQPELAVLPRQVQKSIFDVRKLTLNYLSESLFTFCFFAQI